jgi:hypothetical protein
MGIANDTSCVYGSAKDGSTELVMLTFGLASYCDA